MITKVINVNLHQPIYERLTAKQGDIASRYLLFHLLDGDKPFDLSNRTVRVYAIKPDKTEIFNDLTINDASKGYCTLELTSQCLASAGVVKMELYISESGKVLTSIPFELEVIACINTANGVTSTNEFSALEAALGSLQDYDNLRREIIQARKGYTTVGKRLDNFDSRLDKIKQRIVNALDYGLDVNSSAPQDNIIDLVVNDINSGVIKEITFPTCTIILDKPHNITNYGKFLNIKGQNTILKIADNSTLFSDHKYMVALEGENIKFSGFIFDSNNDNNFITVDGVKHYGYESGYGTSSVVEIGCTSLILNDLTNSEVFNNTFLNSSWGSCNIDKKTKGCSNLKIYNNIFEGGFRTCVPIFYSSDIQVYRNKFTNPNWYAIQPYVNCNNIKIYDNTILFDDNNFMYGSGFLKRGICIGHESYPQQNVLDIDVYDNNIRSTTSSDGSGIIIEGYPKNVSVKNNRLNFLNGDGIIFKSEAVGVNEISNNTFKTSKHGIKYAMDGKNVDTSEDGVLNISGNNFNCEYDGIYFNSYTNKTAGKHKIYCSNNKRLNDDKVLYSVDMIKTDTFIYLDEGIWGNMLADNRTSSSEGKIRKSRYAIDLLGGKQVINFNSGVSTSVEYETTLIKIETSNLQLLYGGYEGQMVNIFSTANGLTISKNDNTNGIILKSNETFLTLNKNSMIQVQKVDDRWYQL